MLTSLRKHEYTAWQNYFMQTFVVHTVPLCFKVLIQSQECKDSTANTEMTFVISKQRKLIRIREK